MLKWQCHQHLHTCDSVECGSAVSIGGREWKWNKLEGAHPRLFPLNAYFPVWMAGDVIVIVLALARSEIECKQKQSDEISK